jgi:hypothetical protein
MNRYSPFAPPGAREKLRAEKVAGQAGEQVSSAVACCSCPRVRGRQFSKSRCGCSNRALAFLLRTAAVGSASADAHAQSGALLSPTSLAHPPVLHCTHAAIGHCQRADQPHSPPPTQFEASQQILLSLVFLPLYSAPPRSRRAKRSRCARTAAS